MGHRTDHEHDHQHPHDEPDRPGTFAEREPSRRRDFDARAFTVGIGGPVGSGKTALVLALCRSLRDRIRLGVVTNDIFTREDAEFLHRNQALPAAHIRAVETGGCPHAAIREDVSHNLLALEQLMEEVRPELLLVESGGDNLAAQFSRELVDYTVYVIDVAGGDKVPRKGGPGITQSDLLVVNKTDLAPHVGADLGVMARDAARMRGDGPTVFAQVTHGVGVGAIAEHVVSAWRAALAALAVLAVVLVAGCAPPAAGPSAVAAPVAAPAAATPGDASGAGTATAATTAPAAAPATTQTAAATPSDATASVPAACSARCSGRATPQLVNAAQLRAGQTAPCYDRALAASPNLRGRVQITVRVLDDGSTCPPRVLESALPADVTSCIGRVLTGTPYPAPAGGCIDVTLPLTFEPRTGDAGAP